MIFQRLENELINIKEKNLFRELKAVELAGKNIVYKGKTLLNLSTNDYLGYFNDERLKEASINATKKYGNSTSSSRLVCGNNVLYDEIEKSICKLKNTESALVFNSGYCANVGILNAICSSQTFILADKLIHASLIDSIKMTGCKFSRFLHNNVNDLKKKLEKIDTEKFPEIIICIESIYSMDGDKAPLKEIKKIADDFNTILFVDEAHSTGIYGENGEGLCKEIIDENVIIMGTFGKALGSFGAYFAGAKIFREYLINSSRSLIYTTALTPSNLASIKEVLTLLPKDKKGEELLKKVKYFREKITQKGFNSVDGDSPIIPIIIGENKKAIEVQNQLFDLGFFAVVIREPTVPKNTARLRITINNLMDYEDLDNIFEALCKVIYNKSFMTNHS